jgi:LysR family cyn operon transcriptional activator
MQRGNLRIGVIQSFSRTLLPPILGRFMRDYPGVHVSIEEMTADAIEQELARGNLDLGIAFASLNLADTEIEPVLQERLLLIVSSEHPFAGRKSVKMKELDGEPMALLASSFSTRRLIDGYLSNIGAHPNVICETNSIEVMLGAVSQTRLSTIIPERAIRFREHPNLRAPTLIEPVPVRTSALLWPKHSFRTAAARTFATLMRERFAAAEA